MHNTWHALRNCATFLCCQERIKSRLGLQACQHEVISNVDTGSPRRTCLSKFRSFTCPWDSNPHPYTSIPVSGSGAGRN
jgi:hypothetical protein